MVFQSVGQKILTVVGLAASISMAASLWAYSMAQENALREQNERSMAQTTDSVVKSLQSVMLAGDADIAQAFSERLKTVQGAKDFRILRTDGAEAFRDNRTIRLVNKVKEEEAFAEREEEALKQVLPANSPELARAQSSGKAVPIYNTAPDGSAMLTMVAPVVGSRGCRKCHGEDTTNLGFVKFSVTLDSLEKDISRAHWQAIGMIGLSLLLTLLLTAVILRRVVSLPIAAVTSAMGKAAGGDLQSYATASGHDEVAQMANSFNTMTVELRRAYDGMQREQDKLTTIIRSAREAIVVADSTDKVTLVNPSAELLLGRTLQQIKDGGFLEVLGDKSLMLRLLDDPEGNAEIFHRGDLILSAQASRINADDGHVAGSAALIRDITVEKTLEEELRKLSTVDALTDLFNRRFLDETLQLELERALRYKQHLSILMLDVDHFKKFNDQHGHDMGDRVLKAVALAMKASLRSSDFACRYGGEEFLMILPDTPASGALDTGERIRLAVAALVVDGLTVTISVGCATFPDIDVQTQGKFVEKADQALYEAKHQGRNRCVQASPSL